MAAKGRWHLWQRHLWQAENDGHAKEGAALGDPLRATMRQKKLAAGNLAGLEAPGADVQLLTLAVDDDGDALDVRLERTADGAVRVANRATSNGVLTADITDLRHDCDLQRARRLVRPLFPKAV